MPRAKGKPSKGQPKGNRSASGRKRDRTPLRLGPCEGILRRRELYRVPANDDADNDNGEGKFYTDTCDALGRAYCAGLLGSGERAKDLLVAGRKIARQYWRVYVDGSLSSNALARFFPVEPGKPMSEDDRHESDRILEQALTDALALVRARGHDVRRAFDHLVIDVHADHGPAWLDAIVWANRHGKVPAERDSNFLRLAIEGLEAVA
jgi:hypothetical protein